LYTEQKVKQTASTSQQSARFVQFFQDSAADTSQAKKLSTCRKRQMDDAFFKMIVQDYQPLTLGERKGMRHFANCALPGYVPPCYSTVRDSLMPSAMREVEQKVELALRDNSNYAITTDIWTSRRGHPFIAFICTYVTEQFEGKAVLLGCFHMPGHHTAESIHNVFDMCVTKWRINDSITRVVSDNASNMVSAFRLPGFTIEFEVQFMAAPASGPDHTDSAESMSSNVLSITELEMSCDEIVDDENDAESAANIESAIESAFFASRLHLPCPIHTLQLAIKDSFDECHEVSALTTKAAKLVSSIRRSTLNTAFTDALGVRPSVACITRWNSQLQMIESVLKLSERDADFQGKLSVPEAAKLSAVDLRALGSLLQALLPLAELTDTLQGEFGTLGAVLPSVAEVHSLLRGIKSPIAIGAFAEILAQKFKDRFQKYYSDVHLTVAAVLDPRFKCEWIARDTNVREKVMAIRQLIEHEANEAMKAANARTTSGTGVNDMASNAASGSSGSSSAQSGLNAVQSDVDEPTKKKPRLIFASYSIQVSDQGMPPRTRTAGEELNDYLSSPRLPSSADVLSFWKTNRSTYPHLAELARATYSIPSGSASAERCFSAAGLITRVHRLSLKPQTLEKLVFLKVNSALLL